MKPLTLLKYLVNIALALALVVVMLGAYTRLTDAGLGCPDWPGCYGHMVLPQNQQALNEAGQSFQEHPIETRKAWTEMIHRYFAGTLGLLIFVIAGFAVFTDRSKKPDQRVRPESLTAEVKQVPLDPTVKPLWWLPSFLSLLVIFQALLGMWTVTLKLLPIVVMGHLLGGMLIFALLFSFRMQLSDDVPYEVRLLSKPAAGLEKQSIAVRWRWFALTGLVLVFFQIALGGWVSANYAGIACVGFPQCNGQWLPHLHWAKGFYLLSPVGANYQGGVLNIAVRITIQFIHRMGAYIVFIWILIFSITTLCRLRDTRIRILSYLALVLLILQIALGIINVTYILPLPIAVAHNGVAALLFGVQAALFYCFMRSSPRVS